MADQSTVDQDRLRRIAAVTENFFFWQGLRWVPLGVALLAGFFIPDTLVPWKDVQVAILVAFIVAGFAVSAAAGRWYERTYGHVRCLPHVQREALKWNVVYPLMLGSLLLDVWWRGPFFLSGPVWGAAIVAYRNSTGGGRPHYLVIAALIAALGFAPSYVPAGTAVFKLFFAVLGAAYVAGGLLDHLALTRILGSQEGGHAGTL